MFVASKAKKFINARDYDALRALAATKADSATKILVAAAEIGDAEAANIALANHASHSTTKGMRARTPLHTAADSGFAEVCRVLARAGADVNVKQGMNGKTALILASEEGHEQTVEVLLGAGADTDVVGSSSHNALINAVEKKHLGCMYRLLGASASILIVGDVTALDKAIDNDDHVALAALSQALMSGNYDPQRRSDILRRAQRTIVACPTVQHGQRERMHLLFGFVGAERFDLSHKHINPMAPPEMVRYVAPPNSHFEAAANNNVPMLMMALDRGLHPNTKTDNGMTLLHWACAGNAPDCVQLLLQRGASVCATECRDYTPIFYAMHSDHAMVLGALLAAGANPHSLIKVTTRYWSPMLFAVAANATAAFNCLESAGIPIDNDRHKEMMQTGYNFIQMKQMQEEPNHVNVAQQHQQEIKDMHNLGQTTNQPEFEDITCWTLTSLATQNPALICPPILSRLWAVNGCPLRTNSGLADAVESGHFLKLQVAAVNNVNIRISPNGKDMLPLAQAAMTKALERGEDATPYQQIIALMMNSGF